MLALILLTLPSPTRADCPANAADLQRSVQEADRAYEEWAWEDFDHAADTLREEIGCLSEVMTGKDTLEIHRAFALVGARHQDIALSTRAYRGLLALQPDYQPDLKLAPQGSLLYRAFEQATPAPSTTGRDLPPGAGAWFLDGAPGATQLPLGRTAMVQLLPATGTLSSWYMETEQIPPDLLEILVPPPPSQAELLPDAATQPGLSHGSGRLLVGGAALAVAGVGGLLTGELLEQRMLETPDRTSAERLYRVGLGTTIGGWTMGAAGSALMVTAVVRGNR